jgi:hypothetical protein
MTRNLLAFVAVALLSASGFAQPSNRTGFPTPEEFCRDNPKTAMCVDGHPLKLDFSKMQEMVSQQPNLAPAPSAGARRTVRSKPPAHPETRSPGEVALQDWRFSHPSPAILVNINVGSLLQSPLWKTLFSAWGAGSLKTADFEKARSALSEIGQVLISVTANGTRNPSVLILARGDVDGALGGLLRSGGGMQAKRLDAATMLIGDANALAFASLRMRSPVLRSTHNSLQQAATLEALKYDLWVGVDPRQLASLAASFGGASNPGLNMLASLRSISVGLYLSDQIRMEAALEAQSPEMAGRMLAAYQEKEAKQQSGKEPMGQEWITAEGATVRFIEIVEASRLKGLPGFDAATAQKMTTQIAPLIQALAGIGSARQSDSAAAPTPAAQGAIVIQGLDGGPKQFPAN